ncbi:MAG: DUF502 domain-containing protein [Hyphomicrobiales bacterium]
MSLIDPLQDPAPEEPAKGPGAGARLRNYFLTGLIVAGPIGITLYLTWSVIQWIDGWVKPLLPELYNPDNYLPFPVPGFGLIVAIFGLTMIGFLAANIAGRTIVGFGERALGRMPVVRNLYNGLKQIFETVLSNRGQSFQKVGLVEYPRRGLWALVFVAADARGEVDARIPGSERLISVFLPTTPNPTSGFLLFVPERDVIFLEMSVEDAAKLVISAGLVTPEYRDKTKALADKAKGGKANGDRPADAVPQGAPAETAPAAEAPAPN